MVLAEDLGVILAQVCAIGLARQVERPHHSLPMKLRVDVVKKSSTQNQVNHPKNPGT